MISTHSHWHAGLARAKRWGSSKAFARSSRRQFRRGRLDNGAFEISGAPPPIDGVDFRYRPSSNGARPFPGQCGTLPPGAEVRERFLVTALLMEGGRVSESGAALKSGAELIVGADAFTRSCALRGCATVQRAAIHGGRMVRVPGKGGPTVSDFENYFTADMGGAAFPTSDRANVRRAGSRVLA